MTCRAWRRSSCGTTSMLTSGDSKCLQHSMHQTHQHRLFTGHCPLPANTQSEMENGHLTFDRQHGRHSISTIATGHYLPLTNATSHRANNEQNSPFSPLTPAAAAATHFDLHNCSDLEKNPANDSSTQQQPTAKLCPSTTIKV